MAVCSPSISVFNCRKLRLVGFTCIRLCLSLLGILLSPLLLLSYGILLLFRQSVSKAARYFDPKLGKMVSSLGTLFAAHDVYGNSYTINIALHLAGNAETSHVVHALENLLASSVTPQGAPLYPEMTQRIVSKFGYKFWRNLDNFQVDNHVTDLHPQSPDDKVTLQQIRETIARFGKTPLDPTRSPWHVFLVKNFQSELQPEARSAIIFRLHHVMFDGYSAVSLLSKLADNGPFLLPGQQGQQLESKQCSANNKWCFLNQLIMRAFLILFRGPYELVGQMMSYDDNELIRTCRRDFKGVMRFHECEPISLQDLKEVKNFYGVSMTTLLTTLVVRALKEFLDKRHIITEKVHMMSPLPVGKHPDKLRNYFSGGIISFDMTHDDPLKLLADVQEKYRKFRSANAVGLPEVSMLLLRILGSLPICLTPRIDNVPLSSTLMHSSFPGPVNIGHFWGFPVVDCTVGGSISKPYPTGTLCYSYNGYYKFGVMADASIFRTQEEAQEMGDYISNQFQNYSRKVKENFV